MRTRTLIVTAPPGKPLHTHTFQCGTPCAYLGGRLPRELAEVLFGLTELLGPLTLRGVLDIGLGGGAGFEVVLYPFEGGELTPYVGGGLGAGFSTVSFGLGAVGGLEYRIADNIGLFAELQPGFIINAEYANEFSAALRIGGNNYPD